MAPLPVTLFPPAASRLIAGGVPMVAMFGPMLGGFIVNPSTPEDQGLDEVEPLFVNVAGDAALVANDTTVALQPGQWFIVPAGQTTNVSVNAVTTGHRFSGVVMQPPVPYPPTPTPGPFPPAGPTTLTRTIPSYLYRQYADDDNLQAFVRSYNEMTQVYVNWFASVGLPVYTGTPISGALLDWVAEGLYGIVRPSLGSGRNRNIGPFNSFAFNTIPFNKNQVIGPTNVTVTTDDIFKRIITWHFFKADGKVFNIRWLKRRIMRFLLGTNGINFNVDQTYQVSVTFGTGNQVNITLLTGLRRVTGGALFNRFALNTMPFNQLLSTFESLTPLPNASIFKEAVDAGVIELPFQFEYVVAA